jgi:O-antigen/teichoic acid export membrane protein
MTGAGPGRSTEAPDLSDKVRAATLIGRNFSFRFATHVLSSLINVAGMILLGNYLSAEGYGDYTFYYALIPLIGSMGDLGVGIIIVKEIARNAAQGPRFFGDALLIKGVVSGVAFLGLAALAWLLLEPGQATLLCLVAATGLIYFSQDVSIWIVRAHERLDLESLLLIISQILWLGGIWLALQLTGSLTALLATATVAFLARLAVGATIVFRHLYLPAFAWDFRRLKTLVVQGLPFGIAMFGVVLYGRIGVLLLKAFSTAADVAYFNIGYLLSQPLGFVSTALSMAAFPALARYAQEGSDVLRGALMRTAKFQFVAALPLSAGLFLLADRIVLLLFSGHDYSPAATALRLTSVGLTLIFFNLMARYALSAIDQEPTYLRAIVAGLGINVLLGVPLSLRFGFAGACAAYLLAELAIFCLCRRVLSGYLPAAPLLREAWRPLIAATAMGLAVHLMVGFNVFLVVAAGAALYFAILLALGTFSQQELQVMRRVYASFGLPGSTCAARHPRKT